LATDVRNQVERVAATRQATLVQHVADVGGYVLKDMARVGDDETGASWIACQRAFEQTLDRAADYRDVVQIYA
jgi:hypothetical protein